MEHFQWDPSASPSVHPQQPEALAEELADVTLYLLQLASVLGIDLEQATLKNWKKIIPAAGPPPRQTDKADRMTPPGTRTILAVSDDVARILDTCRAPDAIGKVDFIISCGDLPFDYLELLMSCFNTAMYFVLGTTTAKASSGKTAGWITSPTVARASTVSAIEAEGILLAGSGRKHPARIHTEEPIY